MDRIAGLATGCPAPEGFGADFTDLSWRGFGGDGGDCLRLRFEGVVLASGALDFEVGGFGGDVRGGCFGAVFSLVADLGTGFGAALAAVAGFGAALGFPAGFGAGLGFPAGFGAALGFPAGFGAGLGFPAGFGAALGFPAGFGAAFGLLFPATFFGAAFFGAAFGLLFAAGFFTALGAAARVLFALDDFGAASAS